MLGEVAGSHLCRVCLWDHLIQMAISFLFCSNDSRQFVLFVAGTSLLRSGESCGGQQKPHLIPHVFAPQTVLMLKGQCYVGSTCFMQIFSFFMPGCLQSDAKNYLDATNTITCIVFPVGGEHYANALKDIVFWKM